MYRVIRLMGKNPLDVLDDAPGELMDIFVCCHEIDPKDPSPFSELRCEVTEKQFPGVLERLERLNPDERADAFVARMALDDLVVRYTAQLEAFLQKRWAEAGLRQRGGSTGWRLTLAKRPTRCGAMKTLRCAA